MNHIFFKTNKWRASKEVFSAWRLLQSESPSIVEDDPLKAGFYETFRHNERPAVAKTSSDFNWETIKFDGYLSSLHPFERLDEVISHGPQFQDVRHRVSYYVSIGYQEEGIKQDLQHHNRVQIWFQNGETKIVLGLSQNSRFSEKSKLADLVRQVENTTCFKIGDINDERAGLGISRRLDSSPSPKVLAEGMKRVMDLVGYNKIFYSSWTLTCPYPDDARIQAIKCYNRAIELGIPAERYVLEVVSRYQSWQAIEEMRPLYGPDDCLMHPLGAIKLPKRKKIGFHLLTCAEGHQLVVQTNKPVEKSAFPSGLFDRLESLAIDFKHGYDFEELLKKSATP